MLHGAAWAARRDRASALVEDPQQRHLPDWREQRTRRRAELAEKTARRQAEFTALLPAIAAQVAADVSAAVAAALRTTRVGHHEGLVQAPTTTSAPTTSVADDHDLNRAPATTTTVKPPVSTVLGNDPDMAASYGTDLATPTPSTCSTICLAGDTSADLAASAPTTCSAELPSHAASVAASKELGEVFVTTECDDYVYPVSQLVALPTTVLVDVADCAPTMAAPSEGICNPTMSHSIAVDLVISVSNMQGADDHSIANKHEVAFPLKLLELPPLQTKGQNVSPLLPQVAEAMVSWGTSMNQWKAKISGMCSGFGYPTTNSLSVSLFQWDPGEKPMVLRDSVLSRDIAWPACVKKMNADLSGSHDYDQKSGYADTQTYLHWLIQLSCSSANVIGKYFCLRLLIASIGAIHCFQVYWSHFKWALVIVSSLQTLGSYCLISDHYHCDPESMHWKILWFHSSCIQSKGKPACALSADIVLSPGAPMPATTTPVASAELEPDPFTALSTTSSAGYLDNPEDIELLACSRVEQPLKFVAARSVDDYSLVTNASVVPLTQAALSVHDGGLTSEGKVVRPLKLMEMTRETKEQNMSPLLPQFTQDMVPWDTSLTQLHAKYSDSSGNHDNHQKSGIANIQKYFHWPSQVFCSSQNVVDKCSCKGICVELPWYQFDSAGYSQVPIENFLVGFFCAAQSNFHPLYLAASTYLSMAATSVPYRCAPGIAGMVFPYGSVSLPWELAWSRLFDVPRAIQSASELWSCIGLPRIAVLLLLAYGNSTFKEPMEQWDPGIAGSFHFCTADCNVSRYLLYTAITTELHYFIFLVELNPWPVWELSLHITSLVRAAFSTCHIMPIHGCPWKIILLILSQPLSLRIVEFSWLRKFHNCTMILLDGFTRCESEYFAWAIAWVLEGTSRACSEYGGSGHVTNKRKLLGHGERVICILSFQSTFGCTVLRSTRDTLKISLAGILFPCISAVKLPDSNCSCEILMDWLHSGFTGHNFQLQLSVLGQMECSGELPFCTSWMERMVLKDDGLEFEPMQPVSSDLMYFGEILDHRHIQLQRVKLSYSVTASSLCITWGHSFGIWHYRTDFTQYSRVPIAWNFRGRLLPSTGYDTARDHGKAYSSIPWDPGGAVWWRLGGKPHFKGGGMLATFPIISMGWTGNCFYWAWASRKRGDTAATYTKGLATSNSAWIRTASASSLLSPLSLSCSCSSAPLLCNGLNL